MSVVPLEQIFVRDLEGGSISLRELTREGLLLIFLRHLAWLACQEHLGEVQAAKDEFARKGIAIVVISFASPERLASYQRAHRWSFPILADPERSAYTQFGLERLPWRGVFSLSTIKFYAGVLLKGRKIENYGRDDYRQSGGDFIVDGTGRILFAHRSHDPADRPTVQQLLAAASEVKA